MKRLFTMVALVCVLSVSTLAGDIPISGSPLPPPPQTIQTDSTIRGEISSVPGEIPSVGIAEAASEGLLDLVGALSSLAF